MEHFSLHELLTTPAELLELLTAFDKALCLLVLFLRHEPTQLEQIIECYESLYLLRTALQTYKPGEHGNTGN